MAHENPTWAHVVEGSSNRSFGLSMGVVFVAISTSELNFYPRRPAPMDVVLKRAAYEHMYCPCFGNCPKRRA